MLPPASYNGNLLTNAMALAAVLFPRDEENVETPIQGPPSGSS